MGRLSLWVLTILLCALVLPFSASAQTTGKIAGTITSVEGEALPGSNVQVVGTTQGSATDADGYYAITNLPTGTYDLRVSMIGFQTKQVEEVEVISGRTTEVDVTLGFETVQGEEVVIEAYRTPPVQKDRTHKRQTLSAEAIEAAPVNNMSEMIEMQAGVLRDIKTRPSNSLPLFGEYATAPTDGFHFRGGRQGETVYMFDGINVTDALWGGFNMDQVGELALENLDIQTGTYGAQYGEGMSAVVQMSTKSTIPQKLSVHAKGYTDALLPEEMSNDTYSGEVQLAVPVLDNLGFVGSARQYTSDGYLNGYIYPEYVDTDGQVKAGEAEVVPMQYQDEAFLFGKVIYQPFVPLKLEVGVLNSATQRGQYHHNFKYNPYGTPRVLLDSRLYYVRANHMVNSKLFYEVTLADYSRGFESKVYDSPDLYAILPQRSSGEFSIVGEDWVYFDSDFGRREASFDLTSQISRVHQLQMGVNGDWMDTEMRRFNPDPSRDTTGQLQFGIREQYDFQPRQYSAYVADKMEFTDIGMVLNVGVRMDYIDPNRRYPTEITDPFGDVEQQGARYYVSPRIGVSFPIAERAAFRFGYGAYSQFPDFFQLYQGTNTEYTRFPAPNVASAPGAIASSSIKEEHTVNYEAGVQLRLSQSVSLDLTAFYRESSNLIGIRVVEASGAAAGTRFPIFDNIDFATAKGIELSLRKSMTDRVGGFLNYTYSRAFVSSSVLFEQSQDVTRTYPADWDRPHVVSTGVYVRMPRDWGGSLFASLSSGTPYTFSRFDPNGERAPYILSNDLRLYKGFTVAGVEWQGFVQVRNLLDRKNVYWVYADSGIAGKDANPATSDDYTNNPAMWGPGRRVQIGLQLKVDRIPFFGQRSGSN